MMQNCEHISRKIIVFVFMKTKYNYEQLEWSCKMYIAPQF